MRKGVYRNLFNPDYLINGFEDGCSNFARGRFTIGKKRIPHTMDSIRKIVETCENLQGFFLFHSQGGGTGSGFTSLLIESLSIDYAKLMQYQVSIFPSPVLNVAIVEPYNSLLIISECVEFLNIVNAFNNEACFNICSDQLDINHPTFSNINRVLAHVFSDITVSIRFESSLNSDLTQLSTNLIPYPKIHFITASHSPLSSKERFDHELLTVGCMTRDLFRPQYQLIACDSTESVYMSCCMQYRGQVNPQEINKTLLAMKNQKQIKFVDWCPTGFKLGINCQPPSFVTGSVLAPSNKSVSMLTNGNAIQFVLRDLQLKFDVLFSKRSFVHWFVGEGMEEGEFNEARDQVYEIISDYIEISTIAIKSSQDGEFNEAGGSKGNASEVADTESKPISDSAVEEHSF